jgi:hypothetical protein
MPAFSKSIGSLKYVQRPTGILAQTGNRPLFAVTGRVVIHYLLGEITTAIQAIANATKLVSKLTDGTSTDLCATNDINGDVVNGFYTITGTPANAMVNVTASPAFKLVTPIIVQPGSIELNCAASATGSIKWTIVYQPLDSGAEIYAI